MFDTESDDLYDTIQLAQFYQETWSHVLLVKKPDIYQLIRLLDRTTIIIQNAAYDISTIQTQSKSRYIPKKFHCTLLLSRLHFYLQSSFSLDDILMYTLGYDPYDALDIKKKDMQKMKWSSELTEKQLLYASIDVYYMPKVFNVCKSYINDDNYLLDMTALKYALDFQNNGFKVNEAKRLAQEMRNDMRLEEINCPINVNSWKQVRPYIGEVESDALALARYTVLGNDKAAQVREARKLLKQNSFLKKFKTDDGRIYGKFAPLARSGRFTCGHQNLQQLPRLLKGIFGYIPEDNKVIIYSDFSQLELRDACAITGETVMERLFREKQDMHNYVRDMIELLITMEKGRQVAKTCNFNLLYYGSAGMLGSILLTEADILLDEKSLYKIRGQWRSLFPILKVWQEAGVKAWKKGRHWSTPLGRRYLGKLMTDQLNIQVQGGSADVAKLAMHRMIPELKKLDYSIQLCNFIHDSYLVECPDIPELYQEASKIVGESMKSAWIDMSQYYKIKDLPMPVDVAVGYNWGDIENDNIENLYNYHCEANG